MVDSAFKLNIADSINSREWTPDEFHYVLAKYTEQVKKNSPNFAGLKFSKLKLTKRFTQSMPWLQSTVWDLFASWLINSKKIACPIPKK
jgi:hypothetical protein